jgi:hypothetical protein
MLVTNSQLRVSRLGWVSFVFLMCLTTATWAQSSNATLNGNVTDPTGAVLPDAEITLTNVTNNSEAKTVSNERGDFTFRNLTPGTYDLKVTKAGFQAYVQKGIILTINLIAQANVQLKVGGATDTVTVIGDASAINFENATLQGGVAPETLNNLPIVVGGAPRSSMSLATLLPGVSTGSSGNAFDARINGGLQMGDEAVMDGVSMQQGYMNQSGMVSLQGDFQMSPDMVSEVKVITSNYEAQYGSTTSGQLVVVTKGGGAQYHGAAFEYHRNRVLNARQWGVAGRPPNIQNNFGANFGGPIWLPKKFFGPFGYDRDASNKTFFYFNWEAFRSAGGANVPTISVPSVKARNGDFSDWKDSAGNLIPVYDPRTTVVAADGKVTRRQVQCNGQLNVLCKADYDALVAANPFFRQYLLQYMPTPTRAGELNNWTAPRAVPNTLINGSNVYMFRIDHYIGEKDHFYFSWWRQYAAINVASLLPAAIATESPTTPQNSPITRLNWEHTFSPRLTHHISAGYLNRNEGYGSLNLAFANQLPKVAGVASQRYLPSFGFGDGFTGMSNSTGFNENNITVRPTYVINNLLQWVVGNHTLKFGGEWRNAGGNIRNATNESGNFYFDRNTTGLPQQVSGHPIASFLFGTVSSANVDFRTVSAWYPRQNAYVVHANDTWKMTQKLTVNYGLRWDVFTPMREKFNRLSFFDPVGPNPGAGGRPGRLAFAGDQYGSASYGADFPEKTWKKGFAPRLGIAYAVNSKTVVRTGYGVFFAQAFYPGWGGGMSLDGFNLNQSFGSTGDGGVLPAFSIQQGFPQNFTRPPFISPTYRNGQSILYRPIDANERPYSQQWNLTIERELPQSLNVSVAYVGNKGTRLPSNLQPLNVLNPNSAQVRALGVSRLYSEVPASGVAFAGTANEVREPYPGWARQLKSAGCNPSVAQALLPYPQYCDQLFGLNENVGNSIYHSLQVKAERRFTKGIFALVSYTRAKLITDAADSTQRAASQWNGSGGILSPFDRRRNRSLAPDDVPNVLSAAFVVELPFGKNKRFLNANVPVLSQLVSGWQASTVYRYSSGIPFFFRSGRCDAGAFAQSCVPGIKTGQNPFLQNPNSFDPSKGPLFNRNAFEYDTGRRRTDGSIITVFDPEANPFYAGSGTRVTNLRGPNYKNIDATLIKNTRIGEKVNFQFRAEFFNLGNFHYFVNPGGFNIGGNTAFDTDVNSPNFGVWNGNVSNPRTIQFGARIEF